MTPSSSLILLLILILFHLLFSAAYGTRIAKFGIKSANTLHVHSETNNEKVQVLEQEDSKRVEQGDIRVRCKDDEDECPQSQGKMRKRVASTSTTTSAYIPNQEVKQDMEKGRNKEMLKSWMNDVEHRHASTLSSGNDGEEEKMRGKKHEDLMDMIEMDYSPAMKKPPIHN